LAKVAAAVAAVSDRRTEDGAQRAPLQHQGATAATESEHLTSPGVAMGTVAYMSPEQARGEELDGRTDLFSYGVVLYEMATGRQAFSGTTPAVIHDAILNRAPVSPISLNPGLPHKFEEIINKALEKDREVRYQHASDIRTDLKRLKRDTSSGRVGAGLTPPSLDRDGAPPVDITRAPQGVPLRWRWLAIVIAALALCLTASAFFYLRFFRGPASAIDSIAVLPFANGSADPNTEYLSDGITESLIDSLSQLPNLRVIARSTVFHYKGKDADPQRVGHDLRVRAVLTGRFVERDGSVIIHVELVDVDKGSQLWGEQYTRTLAGLLSLPKDISKEVTEKLRLRLTGEQEEALTKRYTQNTQAYQLYLKGRYYWNKRTAEGFYSGITYFQQAIENDSNYALAYAGLADCYNLLGNYGHVPPRETFPRGEAAATKALELDETLAEAHTSLAWVKLNYD